MNHVAGQRQRDRGFLAGYERIPLDVLSSRQEHRPQMELYPERELSISWPVIANREVRELAITGEVSSSKAIWRSQGHDL